MGLFLRQASMKSRLAPSGSATTPPVRPTNLLEGTLLWPLCKGVRPAGGRRHLHSRSVQTRSLKAGEPGLVLKSQDPLRMNFDFGEPDQPVSSPFLRASYSGSGLSIQRLARSQCTPSLPSVARMVSPLRPAS